MTSRGATAVGFSAILMWSSLAALSVNSGGVPPLQLLAITFLIGGLVGLVSWPLRSGGANALRQDWKIWALGVGGLFSYHALYFAAIQQALAIEVSLIAYLWPMLIVIFSAMLPGEQLRLHHMLGAGLGLIGAGVVISHGQTDLFSGGLRFGHYLAFPLPFIWAGYSLLARKTGHIPTGVISGFCLASAGLSWICHLLFEFTVWPSGFSAWACISALGIFPLGLAFYAWDYGLKRGDIFVLGAVSYLAPLLSTLVLIGSGVVAFHWSVAAACVLITCGALIAARDTFKLI